MLTITSACRQRAWFMGFLLCAFAPLCFNNAGFAQDKKEFLPDAQFQEIRKELQGRSEGTMPLQIFLEVNIFEVLVNNTQDIGFIYDILGEVAEFRGATLGGDPVIESDLSVAPLANRNSLLPAGANIVTSIFSDDNGEVQVVLQALEEDQVLKVHANPTLLTVDSVPIKLESGEDIPYLSRTSVGDTVTVESKFSQTGVNLEITPTVAYLPTDLQRRNPFIHVKVFAELSTVSRFREEQGFVQPIIDSRQTSTTVWLKEKSRILIGGLFRDRLEKRLRGIPILKEIPILGRLFRSTSNESRISHLFVMIRPSIVDLWGGMLEESPFDQARRLRDLLNRRAEDVNSGKDPLMDQFHNLFIERSSPE